MNRLTTLAVMVMLVVSSAAWGQPMADRAPADTIFYVGWAGSQNLGEGYEQSHLKALLDASEFRQLLDETVPKLIQRISAEDEYAVQNIALGYELLTTILRHPTAFYVSGSQPAMGLPIPRVALVCRAGDDSAKIMQNVNALLMRNQMGPGLIQGSRDGDVLTLQFGVPAGEGALADQPAFLAAMKHMTAQPVLCVYFNAAQLLNYADKQVEIAGPQAVESWTRMRAAMNLDSMKRFTFSGGFVDRDWAGSVFMEAPSPRSGIITLLDPGQPLDKDTLRLIPDTAHIAGAVRFDLVALFDELMRIYRAVSPPGTAADLDNGLAEFSEFTGMDLRDDLLASFGKEWAWYADAHVGGNGLLGISIINRAPEPEKLSDALAQLSTLANEAMAREMGGEEISFRIRTVEREGATLHYLAVPMVAPTAAVHGDRLYVALQPQTVVAAMRRDRSGGKSILDNPAFAKLREQAAGKQPIGGFDFYDLPQTIGSGYNAPLMLSRLATGFADMLGIDAPPLLVPPIDIVIEHITPAGSFAWSDDSGIHYRSRGPFPAAKALITDQSMFTIQQQAMALGILLPALGRAREIANRAASAANMRATVQSCWIYSQTHQDQFPVDVGVLIMDGSLTWKNVVHPDSGKRPPPNANVQQQAQWAVENMDYVYLGGSANMRPDSILIY